MTVTATDEQSYQVAIDTGGTFTDVAVRRPDGSVFVWKVSSTPQAPDDAVIEGLQGAMREIGITAEQITRFVHGTTVATNTVITRTGARVGLVTTGGFRDLLAIGHQTRPALYDQTSRRATPLIPDDLIWEIDERLDFEGNELRPLDTNQLEALVKDIKAADLDVLVVSLLNAYADPRHELEAVAFLTRGKVAGSVFGATQISPEIREFERTSTAALNGYVQPKIAGYIERLESRVKAAGVPPRMWIMQSNGGLLSPETARKESARTVLSGLAGGVVGAAGWARLLGLPNVVSFDIGGTSTDIALIRNGRPDEIVAGEIESLPLRMPAVDVHTIGAGGGSIAWQDSGGGLRVGPQSAGADPGPVCYQRGGTNLTVTDAHVVLGRLGTTLLGGRLQLDAEAARQRMAALAAELELSTEDAAAGIIKVINANMARGVRRVSVERGVDLRNCDLMAFGGAGPLHGADLIQEIGIKSAVIPPMPGIASAVGMLDAPVRHDFSATVHASSELDIPLLEEAFRTLESKAGANVGEDVDLICTRLVDARYVGQSYELTIPYAENFEVIRELLDQAHAERYGFDDPGALMEVVAARVVATVEYAGAVAPTRRGFAGTPSPRTTRPLYADGMWHEAPVYDRDALSDTVVLDGPLIIEQFDSTIVVNPGQTSRTDEHGFLHISAKDHS
ncbi:hydantoinase/oxoprolinase family protein [Arthrobacter sp. W4I7]|uniref:hydantoinase/oxoprolinase family protein n=1 Tax=Arthrobacter sp. W4I7 TaxID=3042296 RepID=UPI00278165C5|nr:hydantoinase/oxoprolinase family protein [Arthrobacter sp. W4I7]MDQ0693179.1 N-methylhydantoinase A [Arthrobacter sp. W4I7]